ncbi:unnamed protein product [Arctogadus glacialis]
MLFIGTRGCQPAAPRVPTVIPVLGLEKYDRREVEQSLRALKEGSALDLLGDRAALRKRVGEVAFQAYQLMASPRCSLVHRRERERESEREREREREAEAWRTYSWWL